MTTPTDTADTTNIEVPRPWDALALSTITGGIIAGLVDIPMAAVINHVGPGTILRVIASGLLGASAYLPGTRSIWIGLGAQLVMSSIIAGIYVIAAEILPRLRSHSVAWGLAYGIAIFIVMNMVVAPLSAVTPKPHVTMAWLALNVAAMLLFGVIISLITKRGRAWS